MSATGWQTTGNGTLIWLDAEGTPRAHCRRWGSDFWGVAPLPDARVWHRSLLWRHGISADPLGIIGMSPEEACEAWTVHIGHLMLLCSLDA